MSQEEVKEIYDKVQIARIQVSERLKKSMADNMEKQLTRIFAKYFDLLQNPKIPVSEVDQAKRDMTKFLDIMVMNSDHDVIMALTNRAIEKQYKEKIKNGS